MAAQEWNRQQQDQFESECANILYTRRIPRVALLARAALVALVAAYQMKPMPVP